MNDTCGRDRTATRLYLHFARLIALRRSIRLTENTQRDEDKFFDCRSRQDICSFGDTLGGRNRVR